MSNSSPNFRCQACGYDDETVLLDAPDGLELLHCHGCRLTSVVNPVTTVNYDANYVSERYDRYQTTETMSRLRLCYVETVMKLWESLPQGCTNLFAGARQFLDVGYGNGSFLRWAHKNGWDTFGNDVNPTDYFGVLSVSLPDPLMTTQKFRAITFFDALEHFEYLHQVKRVSACTEWIFVTAPLPPLGFPVQIDGGIAGWKHWRPGEHHHFFHPETLEELFTWEDTVAGIQTVAKVEHTSHFEDVIRKPGATGYPNTFTCALRCTTVRG